MHSFCVTRQLVSVFIIGLLVWSASSQAQVLPVIEDASNIRLPADFTLVDYYLITVDVGDQVWDNFGHTALRVVDRNTNSDIVFNWGLFDASGGNVAFASDFFAGVLNYQLGVSPPQWEFNRYIREERTVWQDKLNLTNQQKAILYRRLAWNLREENVVYSYQYFFDNCTTRVRDYLNEALGGKLQAQNQAPASRTFRDEVSAHYRTVPLIQFALDVVTNSRIDRRMTQWEEMFLPSRLRQELLRFPSDASVSGQSLSLLSAGSVVAEFDVPVAKFNIYHWIGLILMVSFVFLLVHLKRIPMRSFSSQSGYVLKSPAVTYRLMGILALILALLSGGFGITMATAWRESAHLDLHHNVNLLLFWPTDLFGAFYALKWIAFGRAASTSKMLQSLILSYFILHFVAALAYIFVSVTGISEQAVGSLLIFVLLPLLLLSPLVALTGFKAVRVIRFS
jgi:hypothetical protein